MTIVMYDSITVSEIPADAEAVAGYVGGNWPTYDELCERFPHAHKLSIAVHADQRARCLDVENGDATNAQAAGWLDNYAEDDPVLYTSASNAAALTAAVGGRAFKLWAAHYSGSEHICSGGSCGYPQASATQWTSTAQGRNLDQSLCADDFFGAPAPAPSSPPESVLTIRKTDGRLETFVQRANGEVEHKWQTAVNGGWASDWSTLGNPGR